MNQNELRQLQNNVEIIGVLKSKELELKTSKEGKDYITGKLIVQSVGEDKINEHNIHVFIMASSKLFKGIQTVNNEYKTIDENGIDNADRIKVRGVLKLKEYYNSGGNLVQYNEVRGMIFNRLDKTSGLEDRAVASIETVIEGFEPLLKDELPSGSFLVKGFTVGWGNEVIELKNVTVGPKLAQSFMGLYQPGATGRLSFKLNSYREKEVHQTQAAGFGAIVDIEDTFELTKKYMSNIEVIGGDIPFLNTREYTDEEIQNAKRVRALKLQALQQSTSEIPRTNTGFGEGSSFTQSQVDNQTPAGMVGNEMPEF